MILRAIPQWVSSVTCKILSDQVRNFFKTRQLYAPFRLYSRQMSELLSEGCHDIVFTINDTHGLKDRPAALAVAQAIGFQDSTGKTFQTDTSRPSELDQLR